MGVVTNAMSFVINAYLCFAVALAGLTAFLIWERRKINADLTRAQDRFKSLKTK